MQKQKDLEDGLTVEVDDEDESEYDEDGEYEDEEDDEDFLDEPDVEIEPKSMKDMEKIDPSLSLKTEDIEAMNKIFGNDLDTDYSTVNLDDLLSGDTSKSGIDTS